MTVDEDKCVENFEKHIYEYSTTEALSKLAFMKYIPAKMPNVCNKLYDNIK
jgi:hypothetical protein